MTFGAVAAFSVALYLLDRTRRRQVVSTLRFWVTPGQPAPVSRSRKIKQPFSAAAAAGHGCCCCSPSRNSSSAERLNKRRDHVLILDTSAWMGAALPGPRRTTL